MKQTESKKSQYVAKKPDKQGYIHYTAEENEVWKVLYNRQIDLIKNRACDDYVQGVEKLNLTAEHIPQCNEVSEVLQQYTGWSVAPVEALISFDEFFNLLANKQFPAASFIRYANEIDYLKEPDIFHELFGHCPMLTQPAFATFTHEVGKLGVNASKKERAMLARLYWFTVEFGLVNTEAGLRIYGGGILSSKTETVYALESDTPSRFPFDLMNVLRMPYRYDTLQTQYFIIEHIDYLYQLIDQDLIGAFRQAIDMGLLLPEQIEDIRSC